MHHRHARYGAEGLLAQGRNQVARAYQAGVALATWIDIDDDYCASLIEGREKLLKKDFCPAKHMRLVDCDDAPARIALAGRSQCAGDGRRMMRIVIDQQHIFDLASDAQRLLVAQLEAPARAAEGFHRRNRHSGIYPRQRGRYQGRQGVFNVMRSWQTQIDFAPLQPALRALRADLKTGLASQL